MTALLSALWSVVVAVGALLTVQVPLWLVLVLVVVGVVLAGWLVAIESVKGVFR